MFDFAENRSVDSIDKVPEQFRALYTETETGGFELSKEPTVSGAVEAILGLRKALTASRAEAKEAKGKAVDLSSLSDYGTTVDDINKGFTSKIEELQAEIAKGKGASLDLDKLKEAMNEQHAKAILAKDGVIQNLEVQLHKELVVNRATAAIVEAGGNPLLLMPHVNKYVKAVANDAGQYEVHVLDDADTRRFSGLTGEHMTIKELVGEMKADEKFGVCFASTAPEGGGTKPITPISTKPQPGERNPQQKIADGLAKRKRANK